MLAINWEKIDKFYLVLAVVLILMALLVIMAFRSVFSAYLTAYEVDQTQLETELRVNRDKLEEAYTWAFNKEAVPLEVRE